MLPSQISGNKALFLFAFIFLLNYCTTSEKNKFKVIAFSLDKYFANQPIILTSNKSTQKSTPIYSYFAIKIVSYNYAYNVTRTFNTQYPYKAVIHISGKALDNTNDGDIAATISTFSIEPVAAPQKASGFSTVDMALNNHNFYNECKFNITITYSFRKDHWVYEGISGAGPSESFIRDLETFHQNKAFREALGIEG